MADSIFSPGPEDAPVSYTVPGSSEIVPLACNAVFNGSGASGDYLPALIFRDQSGHVIARVPTATTVTAGDDAEVSWFPAGLTSSKAAPSSLEYHAQKSYTVIGQVIPSGVSTTITFDGGAVYDATSKPLTGSGGGPFTVTGVYDYNVSVGLTVAWPAGAYDRYIEIVQPSFSTSGAPVTWRSRSGATPDDDIQTVFALVEGNQGAPLTIALNAFQASGVNKTIQRWLYAMVAPRLRAPGINF